MESRGRKALNLPRVPSLRLLAYFSSNTGKTISISTDLTREVSSTYSSVVQFHFEVLLFRESSVLHHYKFSFRAHV